MKTPIVYYGGKTQMLKHIMPIIDTDHKIYCEPFFGGGAVFFSKEPSKIEVINDNLDMVTNFYSVMQNDFDRLKSLVKRTLHSESTFRKSKEVLQNPHYYSELYRAWAFWSQNQLSFSHAIGSGFAYGKENFARRVDNKKLQFNRELAARFEQVQIFCRNALDVIKKFDSKDTFFYFDPPYAGSDCGHYSKGQEVFYELLALLPTLQGKWLLSSYPDAELDKIRKLPGVKASDIVKNLAVNGKQNAGRKKTECLTWNY